jgi:hypothetical protein
MTAEAKAKELIEKYYSIKLTVHIGKSYSIQMTKEDAKQKKHGAEGLPQLVQLPL